MTVPPSVLDAYGLASARLVPITIGLINRTYEVTFEDGRRAILQRLHPTLRARSILDLEAVTEHLAGAGMTTPRLLRTIDGRAYVDDDGLYRMLTFLDGLVVETVDGPERAWAAGSLVGRFHTALASCGHTFAEPRPFHDTAAHLARLDAVLEPDALSTCRAASPDDHALVDAAATLGRAVHARWAALAPALPPPPPARIVHGDLKITNLMFTADGASGLAVLDLDTLTLGGLDGELGDALRSWCNPRGESDPEARVDPALVEAALAGFRQAAAGVVSEPEVATAVAGAARIATELSARFLVDVFEDRYFGWDPTRFPSRRAHNLVRARSQHAVSAGFAALAGLPL